MASGSCLRRPPRTPKREPFSGSRTSTAAGPRRHQLQRERFQKITTTEKRSQDAALWDASPSRTLPTQAQLLRFCFVVENRRNQEVGTFWLPTVPKVDFPERKADGAEKHALVVDKSLEVSTHLALRFTVFLPVSRG